MSAPTRPVRLFATGQVVYMRGTLEGVPWDRLSESLKRHISGDFGCIDPEDAVRNRVAIEQGDRILSAYPINPSKPSKGFGSDKPRYLGSWESSRGRPTIQTHWSPLISGTTTRPAILSPPSRQRRPISRARRRLNRRRCRYWLSEWPSL